MTVSPYKVQVGWNVQRVIPILWITSRFCGQSSSRRMTYPVGLAVVPFVCRRLDAPFILMSTLRPDRVARQRPFVVMRSGGKHRSLSPGSGYEEKGELRNQSEPSALWACGRSGIDTAHTPDGRPGLVGDDGWSRPQIEAAGDRAPGCPPPVNTQSPTHPQASRGVQRPPRMPASTACSGARTAPEARVRRTLDMLRSVQPGAGSLGGGGGTDPRGDLAALTPGFRGPYHRNFGAVSAPNLCLPSTTTGLRESYS
jgi:hypothetical protein